MTKRQAEYTLSDVIRLNPAWLKKKQRQDDDSLGRYNDNLKFISSMISAGRVEIASYPFLDVFPQADISQFQIPDINKALFLYGEASKPPVHKGVNKNITPIRLASVGDNPTLKLSNDHLQSGIDKLKRKALDLENEAKYAERQAAISLSEYRNREQNRISYMKEAETLRVQIDQMESNYAELYYSNSSLDPDKIAVLKAVPKHYRIVDVQEKFFKVINITPIILTESNAAAGINRQLNLGHYMYKFRYDMDFREINYFADNIDMSVKHPHVNSYICWGNLDSLAANKLKNKDYAGWWKLFDQLQTNYNSGSPFTAWENYVRNKNKQYVPFKLLYVKDKKYKNVYEEIYANTTSSRFKQAWDLRKSNRANAALEKHTRKFNRKYNRVRKQDIEPVENVSYNPEICPF